MTLAAHEFGDWDRLSRVLNQREFRQEHRKQGARANRRIGNRFVREARKRIQAGEYAKNSEFTEALKGSSLPLANDGDLIASITYKLDPNDPLAVWVGSNRRVGALNLAKLLHDGFWIRSTPKSRRYLFARLREVAAMPGQRGEKARAIIARSQPPKQASTGKLAGNSPAKKRARAFFFAKVRPQAARGTATVSRIRVPPRPYITTVLQDSDFQQKAVADWRNSLIRTFEALVGPKGAA